MTAIDGAELDALVQYWRCANYLTVAQIYLQANPLLREPLRAEHIKPRLLGHWGTSPGLSLVYVQLNRLIRQTGRGRASTSPAPATAARRSSRTPTSRARYSELYPEVTPTSAGLVRARPPVLDAGRHPEPRRACTTPGSIHEGGELGYALVHAFGAAFDHPDLLVACVVGDGEAETGPLAGSWKGIRFLNPRARRRGAADPAPERLQDRRRDRARPARATRTSPGSCAPQGYEPQIVAGDDPHEVHRRLRRGARRVLRADPRDPGGRARSRRARTRAPAARGRRSCCARRRAGPGPDVVDGVQIEGTFRAHQVPLSRVRENPEHLAAARAWLRSYAPERLFDERGRLVPELAALAPDGDQRMGSSPYANGGRLLRPLDVPSIDDYALGVEAPGASSSPSRPAARRDAARHLRAREPDAASGSSARTRRPATGCRRVFDVTDRCLVAPILADRRPPVAPTAA